VIRCPPIRVVRREREDGHTGLGERHEERGEHAGEREIQRPGDHEHPPAAAHDRALRRKALLHPDRDLVGRAHDRRDPLGRHDVLDPDVRSEAHDREALGGE
jgi:hypothetical protein